MLQPFQNFSWCHSHCQRLTKVSLDFLRVLILKASIPGLVIMDFLAVSGIQKHLSLDFYLTERIFQLSGAQQILECFEKSRVSGVGPNLNRVGAKCETICWSRQVLLSVPSPDQTWILPMLRLSAPTPGWGV